MTKWTDSIEWLDLVPTCTRLQLVINLPQFHEGRDIKWTVYVDETDNKLSRYDMIIALGVPKDYATNSMQLGDAYLSLSCAQDSFTSAPYYLLSYPPQLGQDIEWGKSNAVVYANLVLGPEVMLSMACHNNSTSNRSGPSGTTTDSFLVRTEPSRELAQKSHCQGFW
jgi:hypothetical protein